MELDEFKREMRVYRGRLSSMDEVMANIYVKSSDEMFNWALQTKHVGLRKISEICDRLTVEEQDEFLIWHSAEKRRARDIDLKLMEY
jgi:hypothetical protein